MPARFWHCLVTALALAALPRPTSAEPAGGSASPEVLRHVLISKVGHADEWAKLERLLQTFLKPHGFVPLFREKTQLDTLGHGPQEGSEPHVWIQLVSAERARLVLSAPRRGRYLLRDVALHNGLDEVGRETLAQVIEASLLALDGRAQALNREQLERLLEEAATAPPPPTHVVPPAAPSLPIAAPPGKVSPRAGEAEHEPASLRVAPSYLIRWAGPDLRALHGLGAAVAWLPEVGQSRWGVALTYELRLPQRHADSLVALSVRGHGAWLTSRFESPLGAELSFIAEAGFGLAWSRLVPSPIRGGLTRLEPESTDTTPWLRFEVGIQRRWSAASFQLSAVSDVAMVDTHYDVTRDGRRERWLTPWPVSPGLRSSAGWDF